MMPISKDPAVYDSAFSMASCCEGSGASIMYDFGLAHMKLLPDLRRRAGSQAHRLRPSPLQTPEQ